MQQRSDRPSLYYVEGIQVKKKYQRQAPVPADGAHGIPCLICYMQQTTNFATSFLIFKDLGMIFHENRLPADGSLGMPCLICYF